MKTADPNTIQRDPSGIRVLAYGVEPGSVDRRMGIIKGYSVATLGEARGHKLWLDSAFLDQLTAAGNASPTGIKARFTHPGMSSDGIGTQVGKAKDFRRIGDRVLADLHFISSAYKTPQHGNLADYLMQLAEDAPEDFGSSIAFTPDKAAQQDFAEACSRGGVFQSPDPGNTQNMPHVRLGSLRASDLVGEPAANPAGLFAEDNIPQMAEELISYAFGISEDAPDSSAFGVHPDRARTFVQGFIERHGLKLATISGDAGEASGSGDSELGESASDAGQILQEGSTDMGEETTSTNVDLAASVDERSGESSGLSAFAEAEIQRINSIKAVAATFGLSEYGEELSAGDDTLEEATRKLKERRREMLQEAAPESPGPNPDPELSESDSGRSDIKLSKRAQQIRDQNPNMNIRDALLQAQREIEGRAF